MALAFVQGPAAAQGSGVTSITATFGSNNTAGNLIVVGMGTASNHAPTATDTRNSYTQAVTVSNGTVDTAAIAYAKSIGAGANTVTETVSASDNLCLCINEYSGADTVSPAGPTNSGSGSSTAPSSGSVSPTGASVLYVGFVSAVHVAAQTITKETGWNERQNQVTAGPDSEYEDFISSGAQTATWTLGTSKQWAAVVATFLPHVTLPSPVIVRQSVPNAVSF